MVKVSVIIPVYNMEKYLEQCLDSVVSQTLNEIEAVCIDDGSSDASASILKEYSQRDSRVKFIQQENQGVSLARNKGIQLAEGKYVIFMDPDDWYPSADILEDLYNVAETHRVSIAGGTFMDYHDGIYNEEFPDRYFGYHFEKEGVIDYKDYQFDFGYQRFIFEKKLLTDNNIVFKEYKRFQDPPFLVEAMIKAEKFYGMNKPSYCYRYGHVNVVWNEEKVCALLQGITDNLDISKEHNLAGLHILTARRLYEEYSQLLGDSIFYEDYAIGVAEAMLKTYEHIDSELLKDNEFSKVQVYSPALQRIKDDSQRNIDWIDDLKAEVENLKHILEDERRDRDNLIAMKDGEIQFLNDRIDDVYSSFSYRVGHFVTILPRFIARIFKRDESL